MSEYDVIVVGGGFAGTVAARDVAESGKSVLALEARDRLGGRTWYKKFAGTEKDVEFGGTWVAPRWQPHVGGEIERYGLSLIESPSPHIFSWPLGGTVSNAPFPIPVEEWLDFERAITHLNTQAARIKFGEAPLAQPGLEDLDIPFDEFIDALKLPAVTREFLLSWAGFYFGNYPARVSALHILSWVAGFGNSAVGWYVGVSEKLAHGTKSLIDAIAADGDLERRLSTPVAQVEHGESGVRVTTREGSSHEANSAVIATPINTWHSIDFRPGLSGSHGVMADEQHAGKSVKIWALVRNLPHPFYGVGWDTALKWVATEYTIDEGSLVVGFGCTPDDLDVSNHAAVSDAIREFLPDADVIATDAHDWNADEFSQGTWMAYRPGQVMAHAANLQRPVGSLVFAGSDLASGWAGWIEGAVESGKRAAREVETLAHRAGTEQLPA